MQEPSPPYADDEITLKELILKLQEYWHYLWARKWYLIGVGLLMASVFVLRAYLKPITYTATLTFMVNEDEGGSLGGAAAILGQFGLGGGAASEYNLDKIVSLARSRRIVQQALFEQVEIEGQTDYLANHLIRIYEWQEEWRKDTLLQGFLFTRDSIPVFTRTESRALQIMYGQVVGNPEENINGLLSASYQEETGILSLQAKTENEELSIVLAEVLYDKLSRFYIQQSTEKQQITVANLQQRADSVEQQLKQAEYQLAQLQDNSQGFQLRRDQLQQQRLSREVQVLTILLGEVVKNLSTSEFLLKNATPFFQVVDAPLAPIKAASKSYLKQAVIGSFLGGFLLVLFFIGRKVYGEVMEGELEIYTAERVSSA